MAVSLADERGIGGVSMRAVAERVGVTPMALYPHIGGKTGLLDAMVGRLLAELPPPGEPMDGRHYLREFAHTARKLVQRHPWAAALLFARPAVAPDAVGTVDRIYVALLKMGVPGSEIPRLERMLSTFIIGYAASEAGGRFESLNPRGRRDQAAGQDLPGHAALADWLTAEVDWNAEFDADLTDLEHVIQAAVTRASELPGTLGSQQMPSREGAGVAATSQAREMATVAAHAAVDKKATDVVVLDVSDQLVITDAFVIASAPNERQVGAIVDSVEEKLRLAGHKPVRREGAREGRWVLLDYVDVVVHVQHDEERSFYGLERLWKDCPRIAVPDLPPAGDGR